MAIGQPKGSAVSAVGNAEADFQGDLEMRNFAVFDVATGFGHFKPFHMAEAFAGFGQRIVDGIFDGGGGRADDFNFFVRVVIGHGSSPEGLKKTRYRARSLLLSGERAQKFSALYKSHRTFQKARSPKQHTLTQLQEKHHGYYFTT
ncbi:CbsD/ElaB super protein [Pseudomonas cannabina pv. alisalensis]|nr:CbsD/ElaB super protein [Pseudomonas cannabina pv. alisalensis]